MAFDCLLALIRTVGEGEIRRQAPGLITSIVNTLSDSRYTERDHLLPLRPPKTARFHTFLWLLSKQIICQR